MTAIMIEIRGIFHETTEFSNTTADSEIYHFGCHETKMLLIMM
jgi:hypothetical protein